LKRSFIAATIFACATACAAAGGPDVETFKQVLEKRLLKLRPDGFTERNVLFQDVRQGTPNGETYPFQATVVIRDYGLGYPANRYYGTTCVGKMDAWKFQVMRDDFGGWDVQGAMTVTLAQGHECKPNPSAGVSSIPLAGLAGAPAPQGPVASAGPPPRNSAGSLPMGEWGCHGTGNRILLVFNLLANGTYLDGFKKAAGAYRYDSAAGTITFDGGFMGGQVGKNVHGRDFTLSATINCQASM
jgi:hypothetical protein